MTKFSEEYQEVIDNLDEEEREDVQNAKTDIFQHYAILDKLSDLMGYIEIAFLQNPVVISRPELWEEMNSVADLTVKAYQMAGTYFFNFFPENDVHT